MGDFATTFDNQQRQPPPKRQPQKKRPPRKSKGKGIVIQKRHLMVGLFSILAILLFLIGLSLSAKFKGATSNDTSGQYVQQSYDCDYSNGINAGFDVKNAIIGECEKGIANDKSERTRIDTEQSGMNAQYNAAKKSLNTNNNSRREVIRVMENAKKQDMLSAQGTNPF